jgi:hypothetical protein
MLAGLPLTSSALRVRSILPYVVVALVAALPRPLAAGDQPVSPPIQTTPVPVPPPPPLLPRSPAGKPVVTPPVLKADAALRPAVEKCLGAQALRDTRDTSLVELMMQVDEPPVGMGFDVSLRAGGRTQPVGPVAWSTQACWWAYDVDVPPGIETIDLLFAPSAAAVVKLRRKDVLSAYNIRGLESIWDGETVVAHVKIRTQRLDGMMRVEPPPVEQAREDQIELLEGDDPAVRQFKRDGDLAAARRQLERTVQENPKNAVAVFNLGCLTVAGGDWRRAPEFFAKVRAIDPSSPLADKAQRQLRRIGGYFMYFAQKDDAGAMCGLGMIFERGWGPKPDRQEAKKWYRSAALVDNADAMCRLGFMYEQDLAAGQSDPKARAWYQNQVVEMYRKSADLGNEEAKKWVATHVSH